MKKVFLNVFVFATIGMSMISCKNEAKNETEAKDAEEVTQASEEAVNYNVLTEESTIKWKGTKPVGGGHNGSIDIAKGEFKIMDGAIEGGKVVVDMETITAEDLEGEKAKNLEAHLMGTVEGKEGDFFNVQEYPEATFEVTGFEKKEGKNWLTGNLTLKENTKSIDIPVDMAINSDGSEIKITSEPFTIDRTDWEVNYGSKSVFDNLVGDNVISDDIELQLMVKAKKA